MTLMAKKQPNKKEIQAVPVRPFSGQRVYSNHVEINVSPIEMNIKFCDARPPENIFELEEIDETRVLEVPIVSEVVMPVEVARQLKKILNERLED